MLDGHQRQTHANAPGQHRPPDVGAEQYLVGANHAAVGDDAGGAAVLDQDVAHSRIAVELGPATIYGQLGQGGGRLPAARVAVGGDVVAAEDGPVVEDGNHLPRFGRRNQMRFQPVSRGQAVAAQQVLPAGFGRRHLNAADGIPAWLALVAELAQQPRGVLGHLAHEARAVGLEDEARRVGGGAAGLVEGAAVDDDDVAAAELGQVVGGATTDNARADDDCPGMSAHSDSGCTIRTSRKDR